MHVNAPERALAQQKMEVGEAQESLRVEATATLSSPDTHVTSARMQARTSAYSAQLWHIIKQLKPDMR